MVAHCQSLLNHGSCPNASCKFRHDVHVCEPCSLMMTSTAEYNSHIKGAKHHRTVTGKNKEIFCDICELNLFFSSWKQHIKGRRHRHRVTQGGTPTKVVDPVAPPTEIPGQAYCTICLVHVPTNAEQHHLASWKHTRKERYAKYKAVMDEAEKDKHGVTISGNTDFDIIEPADACRGVSRTLVIQTTVPFSKIALVAVYLWSTRGTAQTSGFSLGTVARNVQIVYGTSIELTITLCHNFNGRYEDHVEMEFEDLQLRKRFVISRTLRAIVGDKADHEMLKPTAPYVPRKRTSRLSETQVVEGVFPDSLKAIPYVTKLPKALVPAQLSSLLSTGSSAEVIGRLKKIYIPQVLTSETYGRHFKALLWIEEFRMENDLEIYDISDAKLEPHLPYYYLRVPGLAEKRPSVLVGDRILVQMHGATDGKWFEGGVHVVRKEEVGLRFNRSFSGWTPQSRYNVHFKLNRFPLRRQHQALDTVFCPDRVLFPLPTHLVSSTHVRPSKFRIKFFNPLIASNPPQHKTVVSILKQPPGSPPFIIFGPPGTGKTVTAVESIRQVLTHNTNARILACAPSNSAADLIAMRLIELGPEVLYRFYAPSRFKDQAPTELLRFTVYNEASRHFSIPPVAVMKRFRVVVTTCVSASVVAGIGLPRGHYSHIFVDEAGQATEPEVMIGIKTIADNSTNIILSGDHKQLGPIIHSNFACELGLETSYMERLMKRGMYDEQQSNGISVIKLTKNFRSHQAILKFPNDRFYGGALEACGDRTIINSYLGSPILPSNQFPIIFHAISGKDDREASSPSFFNVDEVIQVKQYVERLRSDRRTRITDSDIGVITPYHAQVLRIRAALRAVADGVKVGSVEEFQGQERRVIIVSTVRSSREFVNYDLRHTLGFVANPRRFNVAVTRAQALLIIVGDPTVLSLDPMWRSFLNYVIALGGWTGPPPTWDHLEPVDESGNYDEKIRQAASENMNDFTRRMELLTLAQVEDEAQERAETAIDRPWRDIE